MLYRPNECQIVWISLYVILLKVTGLCDYYENAPSVTIYYVVLEIQVTLQRFFVGTLRIQIFDIDNAKGDVW